jgi:ABC-2 type transport system ATP-binding protein
LFDGAHPDYHGPVVLGSPDEVLAAVSITKRFGSVHALRDVTFSLNGPGLLCILGPNGAGKTTLLDIVEGLAEPTSGSYRLFGVTPSDYPRHRVGVVMQQEARLERVTTQEYAELFAAIYAVPAGARRILERARLTDRAQTPMIRLSGGEAARLFVATARVHDPDLLFLDEPTAHLDPESKQFMQRELRALSRDHALVMSTHDLAEADQLADQLLFLVDGVVRASGPKREVLAGRTLEQAFYDHCSVRIGDGGVAL